MNKYSVFFVLGVIAIGGLVVSQAPDQPVSAGTPENIHFTETFTSSQDPGQGHESHQMAMILAPNEGTIYNGSMTFVSSESVQVVVLHEIKPTDARGQAIWTVDGKTLYGFSLVDLAAKAASFEFTGAALALHAPNTKQFTATVSVDGWVRGQPAEVIMQKFEIEKSEPSILLSKTNVPATIPMHGGLYEGGSIFYIMTDASDQEFAAKISERQDWRVELSPMLAHAPNTTVQEIFVFTNGVRGDGLYGYQSEVFTSTPNESEYSALNSVIEVTWKIGQNEIVFESAQDIIDAEERGRVEFNNTGVVVNASQIVWPDGQMPVRESPEITDEMEYMSGQIINIDEDAMEVTFVAHRGWGPDGRTIYYIVTDATPLGPADVMGVTYAPSTENLLISPAAVDLFQFKNGIKGSGPLGFQAGIAGAALGDDNYSPMWRIYIVEWNDAESAKVLETRYDIDSSKEEGLLSVSIARPMNSNHIVNCPLIDPFQ